MPVKLNQIAPGKRRFANFPVVSQRDDLRAAFPSYGEGWDAAIDYGIDVSLIEENLRLTPGERIQQLQHMLNFHFAQQLAREQRERDAANR